MKKGIKLLLINLIIACISIELLTQCIYFFAPENNLKIFIKESYRPTFSNLRIHNEFLEFFNCRRIKPPPAPKKMERNILIVGDSFPFGSFVKSEDSFPVLIQKALKRNVINLSAPGTFPLYYNKMVEVGMRYDPELIIYCIYANDLIDSLFAKEDRRSFSADEHYVNEKLYIDKLDFTHKAARARKSILNCFKSWQVCKRLISFVAFWQAGLLKDILPIQFEGKISYCHPKFWHSALNLENEAILKSFNRTILNIEKAHHFAHEQEKQFLVVLIPCKEMVYGAITDKFSSQKIQKTYTFLESRLGNDGITVLDLTPYLILKEAQNKRETLFLRTDVHFTEAGHRVAAEGIVRFLQKHPFMEEVTQARIGGSGSGSRFRR